MFFDNLQSQSRQQDGIVPGSPNIMSEGNNIVANGNGLQIFVSALANQQAANSAQRTISIKQAYIHRFGNNEPKASLPTEQ